MRGLFSILPLAIVMIAGPQMISAVVLSTGTGSRRNSLAYLAGAASAITIGVSLVFYLAALAHNETASSSSSSGKNTLDYVVLALLVVLAVRVYVRRGESEPPKWMSRLQTATPRFAFGLGFVLFIAMPTDVITMITVGSSVAQNSEPWWHLLPFVGLTVLLLALPLIALSVLGSRAHALLPKIRDWMNENSWVINEIVIAFFLVITITNLQ